MGYSDKYGPILGGFCLEIFDIHSGESLCIKDIHLKGFIITDDLMIGKF